MTGWAGRLATDIAAAVRSGEVTAAQVLADDLDRIARLNAELGAFVRVRAAKAADEAMGGRRAGGSGRSAAGGRARRDKGHRASRR